MKTLGKKVTKSFFRTKNGWTNLKKAWVKELKAGSSFTFDPGVHLLYNALRGKDYRKGFTPTTNRKKIINGQYRDSGMMKAVASARLESTKEAVLLIFGKHITREGLESLIAMLPPEEELYPGKDTADKQYRYTLLELDPYRVDGEVSEEVLQQEEMRKALEEKKTKDLAGAVL